MPLEMCDTPPLMDCLPEPTLSCTGLLFSSLGLLTTAGRTVVAGGDAKTTLRVDDVGLIFGRGVGDLGRLLVVVVDLLLLPAFLVGERALEDVDAARGVGDLLFDD